MFRIRFRRYLLLPGCFLIACLLRCPSGAQQASPQVRDHFLAAQQDQQNGSLDAAVHEYQAVLRLKPDIPEVYVNLGLVYYAQAKFDESARALATAARLKPGMRGVSLWLGIDNVKLHRSAQAAALLREAVRQDPADKLAQSWLGTALWDAGQTDAALLQLTKASVQFSDDPDLLFARGEAYGKAASQQTEKLLEESSGTSLSDLIYGTTYAGEHEWTKAEAHLRRAIEREPHSLDTRLELAEVFLQQDYLPDARQQLDQALTLAPGSASALARSGELLLLMQQTAEGFARIDKAIDIDPSETMDALGLPVENEISHQQAAQDLLAQCRNTTQSLEANPVSNRDTDVALAALYALSGDTEAAQRAYAHIGLAPSSLSPSASLFTQGMMAIHQHRYEDAEPVLLRWLAGHPADLVARYRLIQVRRQISVAQMARLLAVAPDSYRVHQLLGQLYVSLTVADESTDGLKEDDKAIAEYRAVVAAKPDLPDAHFWLGHLYWKHGDADHAFAEFTRELELDPGHPEANAELGSILVAQGQPVEAIPHLELAIHTMPDLWPAYLELGLAYAAEKNYPHAEDMLRRVVTHDQDGSTHYQLGLVLRAEGKTAQAAQVFAQVRAIKRERMSAAIPDNGANEGARP
ncbi:MAG TPA: tetratricopeptide repeat protein [Terracidiphilus sp.]|jgi:tetratricopeptide (TPR) repeat protein